MMTPCTINGQWELILPQHRADRPEWKTGWEKERLLHMSKYLLPKDRLMYVGAEEGDLAALAATWCKDIFLVEPNPKAWPNIRAVFEANGLPNPQYFVGFSSDVTDLFPPHLDPDVTGVDPDVTGDQDGWPISAYGELIGDHGFKELYQEADAYPQATIDWFDWAPTAISIDVEGSEWKVLRGAEKTLQEHKPKIWLSGHPEFMFHQYGEYLNDLRSWIKGFGYNETLLDYQHEVHLYYESNA